MLICAQSLLGCVAGVIGSHVVLQVGELGVTLWTEAGNNPLLRLGHHAARRAQASLGAAVLVLFVDQKPRELRGASEGLVTLLPGKFKIPFLPPKNRGPYRAAEPHM